jgi:hypothetical protein
MGCKVITGGTAGCDGLKKGVLRFLFSDCGVLIFGLRPCNEHHNLSIKKEIKS